MKHTITEHGNLIVTADFDLDRPALQALRGKPFRDPEVAQLLTPGTRLEVASALHAGLSGTLYSSVPCLVIYSHGIRRAEGWETGREFRFSDRYAGHVYDVIAAWGYRPYGRTPVDDLIERGQCEFSPVTRLGARMSVAGRMLEWLRESSRSLEPVKIEFAV